MTRVLAVGRTDYDNIAARFPDSARTVLHNLQAMAEEVSIPGRGKLGRGRTCVARPCWLAGWLVSRFRATRAQVRRAPPLWPPPPARSQLALCEFPHSLSGAQQYNAAVGGDSSAAAYQFGPRISLTAPVAAGGAPAPGNGAQQVPLNRMQERAVGNVMRMRAIVDQFVVNVSVGWDGHACVCVSSRSAGPAPPPTHPPPTLPLRSPARRDAPQRVSVRRQPRQHRARARDAGAGL